jgi:CPA1 family monovalent cation:H+ antiporter
VNTLEIVSILIAIAALFGLISTRVLRLPLTIGTMLLTVCVALVLDDIGRYAPGLHAWAEHLVSQIDFESLILNGMLPLLLFAGAFLLDPGRLAREKLPVAILSIPGTVACFLAVAGLMKLFTGAHSSWTECLIFGALISPTDPIAVLEMLRRIGINPSIEAQLAGESLFNDGIGAVLFLTMIEIARGHAPTAGHVIGLLFLEAGGAIVLGIAASWLISWAMGIVNSYQVEILLTLALAFGGYLLALLFHLSAPLEAVVAGISLRQFNRVREKGHAVGGRVAEFWEMLDEVQNSLLFVLLGLEVIAVNVNGATFRKGLAAIVTVNLVRLAVVAVVAGILYLLHRQRRTDIVTLSWGGLRGGLSIALALSVPAALSGSWIVGATYLVVVFSILVQGSTLHLFMVLRRKRTTASAA